ncbi:MAG: hypothetical protein KDN20_08285 [Verrucomicrobiae bacterium]|nr:hypothetical protein [Verrucomicrobiae bacterium]
MKTNSPIFFFLFSLLLLAVPPISRAQTADDLIAEGDALDAAMKTSDALKVYLEAEKLTPEDPELLIKIATQYGESMVDISDEDQRRAAGQNALTYSQRAAKIAPNLADAHLAVAICYGRLLDLMPAKEKVAYSREVKTSTERALELDPSSDYAWHMLGRWHRAVATTSPILKGIVTIVYGGLPEASNEEAAAAFEKAIQINPNRVSHHIELGITYAEMGREEDARNAIKRGLALPNKERDDPDTKARGREILKDIEK